MNKKSITCILTTQIICKYYSRKGFFLDMSHLQVSFQFANQQDLFLRHFKTDLTGLLKMLERTPVSIFLNSIKCSQFQILDTRSRGSRHWYVMFFELSRFCTYSNSELSSCNQICLCCTYVHWPTLEFCQFPWDVYFCFTINKSTLFVSNYEV